MNRRKEERIANRFHIIGSILWCFLVWSCSGDEYLPALCDEGAKKCAGNKPQTCTGGEWKDADACENSTCMGGACEGDCAPGDRCLGNTPQTCNEKGHWENKPPCTTGEVCSGGNCTCITGDLRCFQNAPQQCTESKWIPLEAPCTNSTCDPVTVTCIGVCAPEDKKCKDDQTTQACDNTGQWVDAMTCPYACVNGKCAACAEGQKQCNGQQPQACDTNGQWVDAGDPCVDKTCIDGLCNGDCIPKGKRCLGETPQECNDEGHWVDGQPCTTDEYCQAGECVLDCVPGDLRCFQNAPQLCDANGQWQDIGNGACEHSTCNLTTVQCEGVCAPQETQCSGNMVQTCNPSGNWQDDVTCPDGCWDGACPTCFDGVQNGYETDIDCGSICDAKCGDSRGCKVGLDCVSDVCFDMVCRPANCADLVKNGDETDIDCGGNVCPPCITGKSCLAAADCQSMLCVNETCVLKFLGQSCTGPAECLSGLCVDDVCCASACSGVCQACSSVLSGGPDGVCSNIPAFLDPEDECISGACDGTGACKKENGAPCTSGNECATAFCVDGVCCNSSCFGTCKTCNLPGSAGTCSNIPAGQTDPSAGCSGPNACDGLGLCKKNNGFTCGAANECASNFCVDGVCCNNACTGVCRACTFVKTGSPDGLCSNIPSGVDPDNECPVGDCNGSAACSP